MEKQKNKMRKAIIFTLDGFQVGGLVTMIAQYAQVAFDLGYEPIVIGCVSDLTSPERTFQHCKICTIKYPLTYSLLNRIIAAPKYILALHRIYKNYDVVLIHFGTIWSTFYALFHPFTWKIKRVITLHGFEVTEVISVQSSTNLLLRIKANLRQKLQFLCINCSDEIIVLSKYSANWLYKLVGKSRYMSITLIEPYIEISNFRTPVQKTERTQLHILNIGRAERRKGIRVLLEALSYINKKNISIIATIVSPILYFDYFDLLDYYESLNLFDTVHFLHKADEQQKEKLYKNADLFVMPSIAGETFGLAALEALAHGIPVIGSNDGALPEILGKIDTRLIVPKNNPRRLAEAIIRFYGLSFKEKQRISLKAMTIVRQCYTYDKMKNKLSKIYGGSMNIDYKENKNEKDN